MLFITTYRPRGPQTEEAEKRLLRLFANYQVPSGVEVKGWWVRADATGVVVSETESAENLMAALAPWQHAFQYDVQPALDIASATKINEAANAWRDSIK